MGIVASVVDPERTYRFEDVSLLAGIPQNETITYGSVFVDYDRNGWPDLLIGRHWRRPWFLVNDSGGFTSKPISDMRNPPAERNAYDRHSCAFGEANGDRWLDMYCVSGAQRGKGTGPNQLLIQSEAGNLNDRTRAYGVRDLLGRGRSVNWLDYNQDGRLDMFVGNAFRRDAPNVLFTNRSGRFRRANAGLHAVMTTVTSSWADWDLDRRPDLLVVGRGESGAIAYRNTGRGFIRQSIQGVTGRDWSAAGWGDYNGDGYPDLALVSPTRLVVVRNKAAGFRRVYSRPLRQGRTAGWLDVDNDGDLDLFVVQGSSRRFGGNNRPDFVVLKTSSGFATLRHESFRGPVGGAGDSLATADYDRDGRVDVLVTNGYRKAHGPVQLLRNTTTAGHFVRLVLKGPKGNPLAFGTRVRVRTRRLDYRRQLSDAATSSGQSEINPVHLGIRSAKRARIRVEWPGGVQDCFSARRDIEVTLRPGTRPCRT